MAEMAHMILRILFLIPLLFSACVRIPETGKSSLILTTPEYESQLGTDVYKDVLANSGTNASTRPGSSASKKHETQSKNGGLITTRIDPTAHWETCPPMSLCNNKTSW